LRPISRKPGRFRGTNPTLKRVVDLGAARIAAQADVDVHSVDSALVELRDDGTPGKTHTENQIFNGLPQSGWTINL
jgi:hypothetical protein